jgi:hypothetical protein
MMGVVLAVNESSLFLKAMMSKTRQKSRGGYAKMRGPMEPQIKNLRIAETLYLFETGL